MKPTEECYLRLDEVSRVLRVSTRSVRRYIKSGDLPCVHLGGACLVAKDALDSFIAEREMAVPA